MCLARLCVFIPLNFGLDCGHSPMKHVSDAHRRISYKVLIYTLMQTCFWNNEILTPIQKNGMAGTGAVAFKKLKILLDRMMLRRTKVCEIEFVEGIKLILLWQIQRADDLGLPPRIVVIRRDYFSPEEKELYQSLFSDAKRQFSTYVDSGTILNSQYPKYSFSTIH